MGQSRLVLALCFFILWFYCTAPHNVPPGHAMVPTTLGGLRNLVKLENKLVFSETHETMQRNRGKRL